MLAFDSNLAPIVGQQVTLTAPRATTSQARASICSRRARRRASAIWWCTAGCAARAVGFLFDAGDRAVHLRSRAHGRPLSDGELRALAATAPLTFTAVPPGSGRRIGIDRDLDGVLDGDERTGRLAQGD